MGSHYHHLEAKLPNEFLLLFLDATIQKRVFGSDIRPGMLVSHPLDLVKRTTVIISNEEMEDNMKIFMSLEESGLLIKGVSKMKQRTKRRISYHVIRCIRC